MDRDKSGKLTRDDLRMGAAPASDPPPGHAPVRAAAAPPGSGSAPAPANGDIECGVGMATPSPTAPTPVKSRCGEVAPLSSTGRSRARTGSTRTHVPGTVVHV
eukprot:4760406-Prymnesium_polylepis.2